MPEYLKKSKPSGNLLGERKENEPNIYAHRQYRNWRAKIKKAQRLIDEPRAHELYQSKYSIPLQDYQAFLRSNNPLCVHCLELGLLKPGRVLDHIKPIERGGGKYDESNLQWLCDDHHNKKRATEDKR